MSKYVRDKEQRDDKTETIVWAQRIHEKRQAWVSKLRPHLPAFLWGEIT